MSLNINHSGIFALTKLSGAVISNLLKPRVVRANIATTFRCNHRCITCNIWKDNHKRIMDDEISSSEIYKIIKNNKMIWVSLTGGEPFLNRDIQEIVKVCMSNLKMTSIICNGSMPELIEKSVVNALQASDSLLVLNLSLEGDKETHDKVIGVSGSYDKVVETIQRLHKIKCSRLMVGVEHMISGHTNGNYRYVGVFAKKHKVNITYTAEQYAPYYGNSSNKLGRPEKPAQRWGLHPLTVFSDMFLTGAFTGRSNRCVAGEYSCFIAPDTTIYPCLLHTPTNPVKNLRQSDYTIGEIKCDAITKKCFGCWTPCETYATMLFRPWRLLEKGSNGKHS